MKVKSTSTVSLVYGTRRKCMIIINPQEEWKVMKNDGFNVTLKRKGVTVTMDGYTFETSFKYIEEEQ